MSDETFARLSAHRRNIDRYRELIRTDLAVTECAFVERRLAEEKAALACLGLAQMDQIRSVVAEPRDKTSI